MKTFMILSLMALALPAFSATVKVTSFNYVHSSTNMNSPLAELCGLVEGATTPHTFVRVLVDPKTKVPSSYNTLAGTDGKFCVAVITFRGTAEVSIMGEKKSAQALVE